MKFSLISKQIIFTVCIHFSFTVYANGVHKRELVDPDVSSIIVIYTQHFHTKVLSNSSTACALNEFSDKCVEIVLLSFIEDAIL